MTFVQREVLGWMVGAWLSVATAPAVTTAPAGAASSAVATSPAVAQPTAPSCPDPSLPELAQLVLPSLKVREVQVRPWRKEFCVVLVEGTESEEKGAYAVALFALGKDPLATRLKATTGAIPFDVVESTTALDLAKYDVAPNQTAIGVRVKRGRSYAGGGEAHLVTLFLYLRRGSDLEAILATNMSYEADLAGDWAEDGTRGRSYDADTATLTISKKRTRGYFDLVRKTNDGAQHLRWDGSAYQEVDADPFANVRLDIFDDRP